MLCFSVFVCVWWWRRAVGFWVYFCYDTLLMGRYQLNTSGSLAWSWAACPHSGNGVRRRFERFLEVP